MQNTAVFSLLTLMGNIFRGGKGVPLPPPKNVSNFTFKVNKENY